MNRDDLASRYDAAVRKHWRSCLDHSGPTPALLDELVRIAEEHALSAVVKDQVREAFDVPQELRRAWDEISDPPAVPVAADTGAGGGGGELDAPTLTVTPKAAESRTVPARTPSARTRTRTRGGAK